jgi:cellulose synthase/poly-beta-1,6-N-acetylglucosamine synthase-like glycosyltransferase
MAVTGGASEDGTVVPPRSADRRALFRSPADFITRLFRRPAPEPPRARESEPGPAAELDCLRAVFAPQLLALAERHGRDTGIGADRVLIARGLIDEADYLRHLAADSGLALESFAGLGRDDCPLPDDTIHLAARHGYLPIATQGQLVYVVAPRGYAARRIARLIAAYPELRPRIRLASTADLHAFLARASGDVLARVATHGLVDRFPALSAAPKPAAHRTAASMARSKIRSKTRSTTRYLARLAGPLALFTLAPMAALTAGGVVLSLWFLLFTSLRLAGCFAPRTPQPHLSRLPDSELPVYTVVAALYREAASVAPLMRSLDALDYPREKLDIKLVIEPDDLHTRAAIARLGAMPHVEVIIAPDAGPRTKPKALNCALTFARGTFLTVYDAEDRPEPGQLRAALDAFRTHDPDVACVQASLCIDNTADGWLPRMFTAEYAGQFDAFLQGFSHFRMPLPLGGSSNHFRTAVLRDAGGWDPWNVTEDADLGFRLARLGQRCVMFPSTTYEEAPARFGAWLRQRSRWMKGWMQTWGVHMRAPLKLWRDAGPSGFFTLNILVGGNVLTALAHPLLLGEIILRIMLGGTGVASFASQPFAELYLATVAAGYLSTVAIGLIGLARRGLLREAWILALTPLYWICLSIAAWRALYQLLRRPYHWEKTEHGLARHSRLAAQRPARAAQHPLRQAGEG